MLDKDRMTVMATMATMIPAMYVAPNQAETDRKDAAVTLSVVDIAEQCAQEYARYLQGTSVEGEYGYELFRRAVVERDEDAWMALSTQFAPQVRRWLGLRPEDAACVDEITATFERFWRGVTPAKFSHFASLAAVLQYLKLCARSVRLDRARADRLHEREGTLDEASQHLPAADNPAEQVASAQDAATFWRAVKDSLSDERERAVIYLCYVQGLTPREICARYSVQFPAATDVYRLKRSALDHLRRVPSLNAFW